MNTPDICKTVEDDLIRRIDVSEHKSNWASTMGDPCLRRLVYWRTSWDTCAPHTAWLQGRFDTGNIVEDLTVNYLNRLGMNADPKWQLVEKGFKLNDRFLTQAQIGGKPDVALKVDGKILGPVEIKSVNPNTYAQIHTLDSMLKYRWMRNYRPQLTLYEFGMNTEWGAFCLVNTNNIRDMKWFEYPLDLELAEELLVKADNINAHLKAETLPDKINNPDECPTCPFNALCVPDYQTQGNLTVSGDSTLEDVLERLDGLTDAEDEIKELKKRRDLLLIKGQDLICGRFLVIWKHIEGVRKPSAGGPYEQWRKKIVVTK